MSEDGTPDFGRRSFLKATGAAGVAAAFSGVVNATPGREPQRRPNELVATVSDATRMSEAEARAKEAAPKGAKIQHRNEKLNYFAIELPDRASAQADSSVAKAIEKKPGIRTVEENTYYTTSASDNLLSEQYAPQQVNAPTAWDTTLGSEDVTIAIVDQGVKYDHEDLQAQFGSDKGKDFVDGDSDPMPTDLQNEYHGTHVAGIASATTDNGTGVAGISNSRLISCRALSAQGGGSLTDIADAIQWATDQGADIINMSLGGGGYTETMKNAVKYAVNNGTLPICASGNSGKRGVSYPAKYEECIAVGALDSNENLTSFSQYGPNQDVVAPGKDILSTWTTSDKYNRISGTSMACPAASGVAALGEAAASSDLSPTELRNKLKNTAVDVGLSEEKQGSGRVDAANIVGGGGGGGPTASFSASSTSVSPGTTVDFDASGSSDDGSITSYEWTFGDGTSATGQTVSHSWSSAGDYTVTLTVTDDDGNTDSASTTVTVQSGGGNSAPTAKIDVSTTTPDVGETVTFDGSPSSDSDGSISEYLWETDSGASATGQTVEGSWNSEQEVVVTLTVTDDDGATDSASVTINVGGGTTNSPPTADFSASAGTVTVGGTVDFDASASSDSDGSIASYSWDFGDGTTATGQTVSHSWSSAGDYTVTLKVTDDAGASDSASTTITVESGGGGSCGDKKETASAQDYLYGYYDEQSYSYPLQLSDPCQVTFSLTADAGTDFDLYVTFDGRTPTPSDYDAKSATAGSDEAVILEGVDAGQEFGLLVDSYSGEGYFTLSVEELGK